MQDIFNFTQNGGLSGDFKADFQRSISSHYVPEIASGIYEPRKMAGSKFRLVINVKMYLIQKRLASLRTLRRGRHTRKLCFDVGRRHPLTRAFSPLEEGRTSSVYASSSALETRCLTLSVRSSRRRSSSAEGSDETRSIPREGTVTKYRNFYVARSRAIPPPKYGFC